MTREEITASVRLVVREEIEPVRALAKTAADEAVRCNQRLSDVEKVITGPEGILVTLGVLGSRWAECPARQQWAAEQTTRTQALTKAEAKLLAGSPANSLPPSSRLQLTRWRVALIVVATLASLATAAMGGRATAPEPAQISAPSNAQ